MARRRSTTNPGSRNGEGTLRHRVVVSLGDVDIPRDLWRVISDAVELHLTGQRSLSALEGPAAASVIEELAQRLRDGKREDRGKIDQTIGSPTRTSTWGSRLCLNASSSRTDNDRRLCRYLQIQSLPRSDLSPQLPTGAEHARRRFIRA